MKRSREPEEELADKLEEIQSLLVSLKKKGKTVDTPEPSPLSETDESFMRSKIIETLGHVADETPVEITHMPSGVKTYTLLIRYPNSINADNRAAIMKIDGIIEGAFESLSPGIMKLTLLYCKDERVSLKMHSVSIGERNKDVEESEPKDTDEKILHEVETYIRFCKNSPPITRINPLPNKVVQVITGQKIKSPLRFSQIEKISNGKVIQDIEIGPCKDTTDLHMTLKYVKALNPEIP